MVFAHLTITWISEITAANSGVRSAREEKGEHDSVIGRERNTTEIKGECVRVTRGEKEK